MASVHNACAVVYRENLSGKTENLCLIDANYILRTLENFASTQIYEENISLSLDCLSPEIIYKAATDYLNSSLSIIEGTKRSELRIKCLTQKLESELNISPKVKIQEHGPMSSSWEIPKRETTSNTQRTVAGTDNCQNIAGVDGFVLPVVSTLSSDGAFADHKLSLFDVERHQTVSTAGDNCQTLTSVDNFQTSSSDTSVVRRESRQRTRSDCRKKSKTPTENKKDCVILHGRMDDRTSVAEESGEEDDTVLSASSSMEFDPLVKLKEELPTCPIDSNNGENTTSNRDHHHVAGKKKIRPTCSICFRECCSKYSLRQHMQIHSGEKPFQCHLCGRAFRHHGSLTEHLKIHNGVKPFTCPTCDKAFRCKRDMKVHVRVHTGEKPYVCEVCGKRFSKMCGLHRHKRVHTKEKPNICSVCGKGFAERTSMLHHFVRHDEQQNSWYRCEVCDKRFPVKQKFESHKRLHTGEKPFVCELCGKSFASSSYLWQHRRIHDQTKHQCVNCGRSYSWVHTLQQHMKTCVNHS